MASAPKRRRLPRLEGVPDAIKEAIADHYDLPRQITDEVSSFLEVKEVAELTTGYAVDTEVRVVSVDYSLRRADFQRGKLYAVSTHDRVYIQAIPDDGPVHPVHVFAARAPGVYAAFSLERFDDGIEVITALLEGSLTGTPGQTRSLFIRDWGAGVACRYYINDNVGMRAFIERLPLGASHPFDVPPLLGVLINDTGSAGDDIKLTVPLWNRNNDAMTGAVIVYGYPIPYGMVARRETALCPDGVTRPVDVIRLDRDAVTGRKEPADVPFTEADVFVDTQGSPDEAVVWVRVIRRAVQGLSAQEMGHDARMPTAEPTGEPYSGDRARLVGLLRAIYLRQAQ